MDGIIVGEKEDKRIPNKTRLNGQIELVPVPELGGWSGPMKFAPYDCITPCRA